MRSGRAETTVSSDSLLPRAGWTRSRVGGIARDVGEALAFIACLVAAQLLIYGAFHLARPGAHLPQVGSRAGDALAGLGAAISIAAYFGLVRLFERRRAMELVLSQAAARLAGAGASLGVLLFSIVMTTLLLTGHARLLDDVSPLGCTFALLAALFAAIMEELLFRGMLFRLIERHAGTTAALLVSALVFGLVHASNPGATWLSSMAIALEAGLLLGAAYAKTRTLWFPIGLHLGWNFTESGIFGAHVSGVSVVGLVESDFVGARWMTGGAFGPEAGLPAVVVCCAATAILLWQHRSQTGSPHSQQGVWPARV